MARKLVRPEKGRMIAGVCAGFADYFNIDRALVRVIWVIASLAVGTGLLAYLVCWLIIPGE